MYMLLCFRKNHFISGGFLKFVLLAQAISSTTFALQACIYIFVYIYIYCFCSGNRTAYKSPPHLRSTVQSSMHRNRATIQKEKRATKNVNCNRKKNHRTLPLSSIICLSMPGWQRRGSTRDPHEGLQQPTCAPSWPVASLRRRCDGLGEMPLVQPRARAIWKNGRPMQGRVEPNEFPR